ncbi:hypothetical protein RFF05_01175 [Bengtsoniella intestinalis]|uniref:hypothetical protein n=1 Tax=Bengtsoniella intestinalis TaxID=3073143 RepID=UPI00391F6D4F
MIVVWILGVILCLLIAIAMIRVTAIAVYDKDFSLTVKIGFITLKPLEKKEKPKKKKEKKPSKKKKKERPKPTFDMIKNGVTTLLPTVVKTLQRLGKGVRFKPVQATCTIAGADDPASAAILYGKANALIWGVMPQLESVADMKKVGIGLNVDYQASAHVVTCHVGVSITIGRAFAIAAGLLVPALQWYQGYTKSHVTEEDCGEKATA